jgi:cellulose synthase/poly-beta-1,6-N-acetylglucosamine synthase-like glycosyltransferase
MRAKGQGPLVSRVSAPLKVSRASGTKGRRDPRSRVGTRRSGSLSQSEHPAPPARCCCSPPSVSSSPCLPRLSFSSLSLSLQWHQLVTSFSLHLFYFFSSKLFFLLSLDFEALFFGLVLHVLFCCCCYCFFFIVVVVVVFLLWTVSLVL